MCLRRRRGALLALLGALFGWEQVRAQSPAHLDQAGSFELLTYNVAGLPEGLSRSHPQRNLPQVGERLNAFDIALVQEDFAYPLELRRGVRLAHASAPFGASGLGLGDGLSQFARRPFTNFRREAWRSCHGLWGAFFDCLTPKGFTSATQSLGASAAVHVYNVHMDAGWSPEDRAARADQVRQLLAALRRQSAGQAVIVAGDTNAFGPERAQLDERLLGEAGFSDACAAVRCPEPGRVDRVLFRSSEALRLRVLEWRVASEFVDGERRPLSDHLAVAVRFAWQQAAGGPR